MKQTRNILALTLILALMLTFGASAFADDAVFQATQDYVEALDELDGASWEVRGMQTVNNTEFETVRISYSGELSDYTSNFTVGFSEDSSEILFSMMLLSFDEANLDDVLVDVNQLNAQSTSAKLYVDTSDNTVMVELYLLATEDSAYDISLVGTGLFIAFTDAAYEALEEYAA